MSEASNTPPAGDYAVGYKKPPQQHQFKPGQSGNPSGRKKKEKTHILKDVLTERVRKKQTIVEDDGRKRKVPFMQQLARSIVDNAADGSMKALTMLATLLEESVPEVISDVPWSVMTYSDTIAAFGARALNEAFFVEQEKKLKEWRREAREASALSLGQLAERELKRRVKLRNSDKTVSKLDIVVARLLKMAFEGEMAAVKLLRQLVPQKKLKFRFDRVETLRPKIEELERFGPKDRSLWPTPRTDNRTGICR